MSQCSNHNAVICTSYKKGDKLEGSNYTETSIIHVNCKILANIYINSSVYKKEFRDVPVSFHKGTCNC
jgi:hypothetical protein